MAEQHKWLVKQWSLEYDALDMSLYFGKRNFLKKQDPIYKIWVADDYHNYYSIISGGVSRLVGNLKDIGYKLILERSSLLFARRDGGIVPENSLYEAYNGMHFSCITSFEYEDSCLDTCQIEIRKWLGLNFPIRSPFLSYTFACTEDKVSVNDKYAFTTWGLKGNVYKGYHTKLLYFWFWFEGYPHSPFVVQVTRYVLSEGEEFLYNPNQNTPKTRIPPEYLINDEELSTVEMYGHKFLTYPEKYIDKYLDLRYGNWRENYIKVHGRTTFS